MRDAPSQPLSFLNTGPKDAPWRLCLAHGAGAPMDSDFMEGIAARLAERGVATARFEFPYMALRRLDGRRRPPDREPKLLAAWRAAVAELRGCAPAGQRLAIGGKSMGGRMASLVADALHVDALICLGYPFHPPGKPDRLRTGRLETLQTPALIRQGERDPFGRREEVETYRLAPTVTVSWSPDGDHDLKPRKRSGLDHAETLDAAAQTVAEYLFGLPERP